MTKRRLTTNERDFVARMAEEHALLGRWAEEKVRNFHPKDVATLLEHASATARGWCTGRFG